MPDGIPKDLEQLIRDCWVVDPAKRPGFDVILERLRAMQPEEREEASAGAREDQEEVVVEEEEEEEVQVEDTEETAADKTTTSEKDGKEVVRLEVETRASLVDRVDRVKSFSPWPLIRE